MRRQRIFVSGSLGLAVWLALVGVATADDEVVLVPGSTVRPAPGGRVRGEILAETPSEVEVRVGDVRRTIPLDQISAIRYDGQPASLTLAASRASAGALAEAAEEYQRAAEEASGRPFIVQAARMGQARVLADLAQADPDRLDQAITLLQDFVQSYRDGRHIGPALELLARLQIQKEDFAAAEQTLARLDTIPGAASARAPLLNARLQTRRGAPDQAIAALDRLIAETPEDSTLGHEARLVRAESLAAQEKFAEAEQEVRAIIDALPPEDASAQALAYNTLGDCLRAANKPKDALLAYLHTDILYARDTEQHARALAHIAQLWRQLNQPDRARETLDRLRQDYPHSPWLAEATETNR